MPLPVGLEKEYMEETVYEMMLGECSLDDCLHEQVQENLDVLPSDSNLAGAEIELLDMEQKEFILRDHLEEVRDNYDFIIIDCPPSLSLLTINALTAADTVLVPIQCEYYALEGLSQVLRTIGLVKKTMNPGLELEGVVFTMYDARTNLSLEVVENVKSNLNETIYKTIIPRNVRLAEAWNANQSVRQQIDGSGELPPAGSGSNQQRGRIEMARRGLGKGLRAYFPDLKEENSQPENSHQIAEQGEEAKTPEHAVDRKAK